MWTVSRCLLVVILLLGLTTTAWSQEPEQVLSQFDQEPSVLEVQRAALQYSGLDPAMIERWYTRAGVSAIAPNRVSYRLRLIDREQQDERFTDDLTGDAIPLSLGKELRQEERNQDFTEHQVLAQWDLSELIFNPDLVRIATQANRQVKLREDILTSVTRLYYERRRAQVELLLEPPGDVAERLQKELRVQELTAELDGFTGGWYSTQLRAAGLNPY